ncbi:MAG: hypothetical protein ACI8PZ_004144 [Myxococcota bacterium]|jgi:hypothetical protein
MGSNCCTRCGSRSRRRSRTAAGPQPQAASRYVRDITERCDLGGPPTEIVYSNEGDRLASTHGQVCSPPEKDLSFTRTYDLEGC